MAYEPFIPCSTNVVLVILEGGGRLYFLHYFSFLYLGDVFNKTVNPLVFVVYEMIDSQH